LEIVSAKEIYRRYIKQLPVAERLRLLAMVARDLASETRPAEQPKRSIMELHGLGKDIWKGKDAQEYVDQMRDEWDQARSPR
jgi:hypothetical protein